MITKLIKANREERRTTRRRVNKLFISLVVAA